MSIPHLYQAPAEIYHAAMSYVKQVRTAKVGMTSALTLLNTSLIIPRVLDIWL